MMKALLLSLLIAVITTGSASAQLLTGVIKYPTGEPVPNAPGLWAGPPFSAIWPAIELESTDEHGALRPRSGVSKSAHFQDSLELGKIAT